MHWKPRVGMMPTLSSLVPLAVVKTTTGATNDVKVCIMTTPWQSSALPVTAKFVSWQFMVFDSLMPLTHVNHSDLIVKQTHLLVIPTWIYVRSTWHVDVSFINILPATWRAPVTLTLIIWGIACINWTTICWCSWDLFHITGIQCIFCMAMWLQRLKVLTFKDRWYSHIQVTNDNIEHQEENPPWLCIWKSYINI